MTSETCDFPGAHLVPSPNHGERAGGRRPDMIILHYTGMETAASALDWLCREESQVSCHYFVDEEGRIAQLVPEERRPGTRARASGRARRISIRAPSGSRLPMPVTREASRISLRHRSRRSPNCVWTVANAGKSPRRGCLRIAISRRFARLILEKIFLGMCSFVAGSGTGLNRRP